MELPIYTVDAFTDVPFQGNPAAVCLLKDEKTLSEDKMQQIASEMNLSETVYVIDRNNVGFSEGISATPRSLTSATGNRFGIRWFTPTNEVNLCGHATVASASVLFYQMNNKSDSITFDSASGPLMTERASPSGITMNFPLNPPEEQDRQEISNLLKARYAHKKVGEVTRGFKKYEKINNSDSAYNFESGPGVQFIVPDNKIHSVHYSKTTKKLLVRMTDESSRSELESLKLDTAAMMNVEPTGKVKGVIVTLKGTDANGCVDPSGQQFDFISRYFAPWNGIPEDPVTGSAHTVSGAYWADVLQKKNLYARQCSKRGGNVRIAIRDDGRVDLTGQSTIVLKGSLLL